MSEIYSVKKIYSNTDNPKKSRFISAMVVKSEADTEIEIYTYTEDAELFSSLQADEMADVLNAEIETETAPLLERIAALEEMVYRCVRLSDVLLEGLSEALYNEIIEKHEGDK